MFVWNWIQRFGEYSIYKRKRVTAFIIDETVIQVGNRHFGYVLYRTSTQFCAWIFLSEERNMLVAEKFIRSLVSKYGKHSVYADEGMI